MNLSQLGMTEKQQKAYVEKGILTGEQLIAKRPQRYDNLTEPIQFNQLKEQVFCSLFGYVYSIRETEKVLIVTCCNAQQQSFEVVFFGGYKLFYFWRQKLQLQNWYLFAGKPKFNHDKRCWQFANPPYVKSRQDEGPFIYPIYSKIHRNISHDTFKLHLEASLAQCALDEYLEPSLFEKWQQSSIPGLDYPLAERRQAHHWLHHPTVMQDAQMGQERLLFDDLFKLAFYLEKGKHQLKKQTPCLLPKLSQSQAFVQSLPFELTEGQFSVLREMMSIIQQGETLQALVMGDVGCGKTLVAILMMLAFVENGYQTAIMAPTHVLASQHTDEFKKWIEPLGYRVVLLTGDMKTKERRDALHLIESGEAHFIIGTHALLSDTIQFRELGLCVLDEEHRFGVKQREVFKTKVMKNGINYISMTATPIPRTLAHSLYNPSIQTFTIKTLPKGRQPIETRWIQEKEDLIPALLTEIQQGRQAYLLCPMIESNEKCEEVIDVETCKTWLHHYPGAQHLRIATLHAKSDITQIINAFKHHELDVLISTTVIEVGVNVPNATLMGILNAERFGLAQLHQLRGRVGRGEFFSKCFLQSSHTGSDAIQKIQAMCQSTDGFFLSEIDLKLRGAGNLMGDTQSGFERTFQSVLYYPELFQTIQQELHQVFKNEARLAHYDTYFQDI